jgi:hypothetical protein
MLVGQAKKDFEKWLKKSYNGYSVDFYLSLPKAFKYGVIVDWFDSVGIEISIEPYWCVSKLTMDVPQDVTFDMFVFSDSENGGEYSNHQTRPQARQKAIERANIIYNEAN